uniref:Uncharacterized protein n=1 Tax=Rhizophora mucronata TaxID=61149 RepID=A0A2P2R2E5_RHIMU
MNKPLKQQVVITDEQNNVRVVSELSLNKSYLSFYEIVRTLQLLQDNKHMNATRLY